jgi:hypothetical protein
MRSSPRRYLASDTNKSQMPSEQPIPPVTAPEEIGPSAPELQLNNLTGDYERN